MGKPQTRGKRGRPSLYTKERATEICIELAKGKTLRKACRDNPGWPCRDQIYTWLIKHKDFADQYAHARDVGADVWWDEIIDLADECLPSANDINLAKLQIDARKYRLAVDKPKKYAPSAVVDVSEAGPLPKLEINVTAKPTSE